MCTNSVHIFGLVDMRGGLVQWFREFVCEAFVVALVVESS